MLRYIVFVLGLLTSPSALASDKQPAESARQPAESESAAASTDDQRLKSMRDFHKSWGKVALDVDLGGLVANGVTL